MSTTEWVTVLRYRNMDGPPVAALHAWLRDRGIDWEPFAPEEVRIDLVRTTGPECWCVVSVEPGALRRLGLHPDQPTARVAGPPPRYWRRS
jgi:hypothetical protein